MEVGDLISVSGERKVVIYRISKHFDDVVRATYSCAKISLVKLVRHMTGLGLVEALTIVEALAHPDDEHKHGNVVGRVVDRNSESVYVRLEEL